MLRLAEFAVQMLTSPTPQFAVAMEISQEVYALATGVKRYAIFGYLTGVVFGLIMSLWVVTGFSLMHLFANFPLIGGVNYKLFMDAAFWGTIGSAVSLYRYLDYTNINVVERRFIEQTHAFVVVAWWAVKPNIGAALGVLALVLVKAGILPFAANGSQEVYFIAALAFAAGYGGQFSLSLLDRTEQAGRSP